MEDLIYKYFPELTPAQKERIAQLYPLYSYWNERINLISRKDIENLYLHHILHSLSIAKLISFPAGSVVLDVGTGGGFPGIPLAILFPDVRFCLCDSILKKISVVNNIATRLGLDNVRTERSRVEEMEGRFDYVVSRAVTELGTFLPWIWNKVDIGVAYLKGGELACEIAAAAKAVKTEAKNFSKTEISLFFKEEWFKDKSIIFVKR